MTHMIARIWRDISTETYANGTVSDTFTPL